MFEDIEALWESYVAKHSPSWPARDSRHDLASEVEERLAQLDIALEYVENGLIAMRPSEEAMQHDLDWMRKNGPKLGSGEMGEEEYFAGLWSSLHPKPRQTAREVRRPWQEIWLFTEMFYHVAWRLREILAARPGLFVGFSRFDPKGVRRVRTHLIQHPEKPGGVLANTMLITSRGPSLKGPMPLTVVVSPTGESRPAEETIDQGLYLHARELHDDVLARLSRELK